MIGRIPAIWRLRLAVAFLVILSLAAPSLVSTLTDWNTARGETIASTRTPTLSVVGQRSPTSGKARILVGRPGRERTIELGDVADQFSVGDLDGDSVDDPIAWTASSTGGVYSFWSSSRGQIVRIPIGLPGDNSRFIGDWDGDGIDNLGLYREGTGANPSVFYWTRSSDVSVVHSVAWGRSGDRPFALDYDGDGKLDPAVLRRSGPESAEFWILGSRDSKPTLVGLGLPNDLPVPGDYNGDGFDDLAVTRVESTPDGPRLMWYVLTTGAPLDRLVATRWGTADSIPVPADYDGDGKTDIAIWQDGSFVILRSSDAKEERIPWGSANDRPIDHVWTAR